MKQRKSKKHNKKKVNYSEMRCPYCGGTVTLKSAEGIYKNNEKGTMLYVCTHYPECDAYVKTRPGTRIPMGTMANGSLRALRIATHREFDKLHKYGYMTKQEAYMWLANIIQAPLSQAHIGYLGEYYCNVVMRECGKFLAAKQNFRKKGVQV